MNKKVIVRQYDCSDAQDLANIYYHTIHHINCKDYSDEQIKVDVIAFLSNIPSHLQKTIKAICYDLYDGYINACLEVFKDIPIVVDRFHVRRLYRKSRC